MKKLLTLAFILACASSACAATLWNPFSTNRASAYPSAGQVPVFGAGVWGFGSGASATNLSPWSTDIDAANFSLTNASTVSATNITGDSTIARTNENHFALSLTNAAAFDAAGTAAAATNNSSIARTNDNHYALSLTNGAAFQPASLNLTNWSQLSTNVLTTAGGSSNVLWTNILFGDITGQTHVINDDNSGWYGMTNTGNPIAWKWQGGTDGAFVLYGGQYFGDGNGLSNLNASALATGTIPASVLPSTWNLTTLNVNTLTVTNPPYLNATNMTNGPWMLKAGDTATGPLLTTSSTTNSPAQTELVTAQWVRGLLSGGFQYYAGTNVFTGATNTDMAGQPVYAFEPNIPSPPQSRAYVNPTVGTYLGAVMITNKLLFVDSPISVNAYMTLSSGGGDAATIHAELYYSYDGTNWLGDFVGPSFAMTAGATRLYQWTISFPAITSTNSTGFYIQRRFKIDSKGGTPTITFLVGTNATSGPNTASHISLAGPTSAAGNAYLAFNQTFTGTNTFTKPIYGDGSGLTNISGASSAHYGNGFYGTNVVLDWGTSATTNSFYVEVTNNISLTVTNTGWTGLPLSRKDYAAILTFHTAGTTAYTVTCSTNLLFGSDITGITLTTNTCFYSLLPMSTNTAAVVGAVRGGAGSGAAGFY